MDADEELSEDFTACQSQLLLVCVIYVVAE